MAHALLLFSLSILTGIIVGAIFSLFKLPIPAPPTLSGIAGIFGIYLGYKLFIWLSATSILNS